MVQYSNKEICLPKIQLFSAKFWKLWLMQNNLVGYIGSQHIYQRYENHSCRMHWEKASVSRVSHNMINRIFAIKMKRIAFQIIYDVPYLRKKPFWSYMEQAYKTIIHTTDMLTSTNYRFWKAVTRTTCIWSVQFLYFWNNFRKISRWLYSVFIKFFTTMSYYFCWQSCKIGSNYSIAEVDHLFSQTVSSRIFFLESDTINITRYFDGWI